MDSEEARVDRMWAKVETRLDQKQTRSNPWRWLAVAASVIVIFGLGYFVSQMNQNSPGETVTYSIADLDPESAAEETRLQAQVEQKMGLLTSYNLTDENMQSLQVELAELDTVDAEMRQLLGKVQNQEKLLRTLLDHYNKKIRIIERMIQRLEKQKRNENRKNRVQA
jgi:anti-sigma-K factor RskA